MMASLVVVGASLAGIKAIEGARRAGHTGPITLIGEEIHLPYDRPPLSKDLLHIEARQELPLLPGAHQLADDLGITLLLGAAATGLALDERVVAVGDRAVPFDRLVIATGATARSFPNPRGLSGVHGLRTFEDAINVQRALGSARHVTVVGAGFIGSEIASAATARGIQVTMLEAAPAPLGRAVGVTAGHALSRLHQRHGVELRVATSVTELVGGQSVEAVALSDGSVVATDLVVVGIGADPATAWLENSGLTLDNGVVADETLCADDGRVFAAGDVVRWKHPLFGRYMRLEHWTNAGEQGALAGRNAALPADRLPYAHVPYAWSDWYGNRIQCIGLPVGEPTLVDGDWDGEHFVALYREDDRITGALLLNRPGDTMKYRRLIVDQLDWEAALEFGRQRQLKRAATASV